MTVTLRNYELYAGSANPLVGASVALYAALAAHPNPGVVLSTTLTDTNGMWEFTGLADGSLYDVKVTAPGAGMVKWYKGNVSIGSIVIPTAPVPPNTISTLEILDGTIQNVDVSATAGIAVTKLAHVGAGNVLRSNGTTNVAGQVVSGDIADGTIVNADLNAAAAVSVTKLAHVGANNVLKSDGSGNIGGQVVNADIAPAAAIALSKLAPGSAGFVKSNGTVITAGNTLAATDIPADTITSTQLAADSVGASELADDAVVNANVAAGAAIALSKLAPGSSGVLKSNGTVISAGNQIVSGDITDDTITNADVNSAAAIAVTKIAHVGAGNVLRSNGTTNVGGQIVAGDIAPGVVLSNPMTTANDIIIGGASGTPARLAKGANGTVLGVDGAGNLAYTTPLTNPMTTANDLIIGGVSGAATRLAKGANGTVLGVDGSGNLAYTAPLTNPMTTPNDIIIGGASGVATRMAKGANSTYLRVSSGGVLEYGALPVDPGFANPMTTADDLILGGISGAPGRLGKGSNSTVLGVSAGGAVGYSQVTAAQIAPDTITATQLAPDSVGASELGDDAVSNLNVVAGAAIAVAKLAHVGANNVLKSNGTTNVGAQIVDADISSAAAISPLKLGPTAYIALSDNTNQPVAHITVTDITWNTEIEDTLGIHAPGTVNIVIPTGYDGIWFAVFTATFAGAGTGDRSLQIYANGVAVGTMTYFPLNNLGYVSATAIFRATAGQIVKAIAYQNSGGTINIQGATAPSRFQMARIAT